MIAVTTRHPIVGSDLLLPDCVSLVTDLPGLPDHLWWSLEPLCDVGVAFAMRSRLDDELRLFVAAPGAFFPSYHPRVDAEVLDALGADCAAEAVLLTVVHPVDDDRDTPTANLVAPIVVVPHTGLAMQAVLDEDWPLRAPLG